MECFFPGEVEARENVQRELAEYFDFTKRLLQFWVDAEKPEYNTADLPFPTRRIVMAMDVKLCRQFRSVIELCELAECIGGDILSRAMFESVLLTRYLLVPTFVPQEFGRKNKPELPAESISREFRAMLYAAHGIFSMARFANRHPDRISPELLKELQLSVNKYVELIPTPWRDRLKYRPGTYSGLSISNQAKSLGGVLPGWYDDIYSSQSESVHPLDVRKHVRMDQSANTGPVWHGTCKDVCMVLRTAVSMFFYNIGALVEFCGCASDPHSESTLQALHDESMEFHRD